jgi:hypothetical protein
VIFHLFIPLFIYMRDDPSRGHDGGGGAPGGWPCRRLSVRRFSVLVSSDHIVICFITGCSVERSKSRRHHDQHQPSVASHIQG